MILRDLMVNMSGFINIFDFISKILDSEIYPVSFVFILLLKLHLIEIYHHAIFLFIQFYWKNKIKNIAKIGFSSA